MSKLPPELQGLPEPSIIEEISYETSLALLIARFKALAADVGFAFDADPLETDPVVIIAQAFSYEHVYYRQRVNDAVKAYLLPYSSGSDLDVLAAFYDVTRLTGETDMAVRERVVLELKGRSSAGPAERYEAVARSVSADIRTVKAFTVGKSPVVNIAVLSFSNGGQPSSELLSQVEAAVSADDVRVLNDRLVVVGAVRQVVDLHIKVWLLEGASETILDRMPSMLSDAWAEQGGLGRDLTESWVKFILMENGVYKVQMVTPATDAEVSSNFAIAIGDVTIENAGRAY